MLLGDDMEQNTRVHDDAIHSLSPLAERLSRCLNAEEKVRVLLERPSVKRFLAGCHAAEDVLETLSDEERLVVLSLIAVGEGEVLFYGFEDVDHHAEQMRRLIDELKDVENFYNTIGGIVGYHLAFLKLLAGDNGQEGTVVDYEYPRSLDISEPDDRFYELAANGIENLPRTAAIFPVGGAGDRLDLHDDESGLPLPAAKLKFFGRSLLAGMFRDIQGMEYLHYKLTGNRMTIPVALMTSVEKENDRHIRDICEQNRWFRRDEDSVIIFKQPMAPVLTDEGRWSFKAPLRLNMKPGGHGVIWKLAIDHGVFDRFEGLGIQKAFLRQVNNPLASIDGNILCLIGEGFRRDALFGFTACDRPVHISEGMLVIERSTQGDEHETCLKNIEYTEIVRAGLEDSPREPGSPYSVFPSNTNILFADLKGVRDAIAAHPLPGMLINLKAKFATLSARGDLEEKYGGRLETVMQSVADQFAVRSLDEPCEGEKRSLPAFSLFNKRQKTHSTTKRSYVKGVHENQTPVRSFYDLQATYRDLLRDFCAIAISEMGDYEDYLQNGPSCVVDFHPALGPLFHVIGQKVRGGTISDGSTLHLEVAELDMENLHLNGSLKILAEDPISKRPGRCELLDVTVINKGCRFPSVDQCWKGDFFHAESLEIVIEGCGEFYAKGVVFKGPHRIEVDDGCRVTAHQEGDEVILSVEPIHRPSWNWQYRLGDGRRIHLTKKVCSNEAE